MKNKITILAVCFAFITSISFAQKTVKAEDIIKDIKNGKNVSIKNATVIGTLDFTMMEDKLPDLPKKKKWWKNGNSNSVKYLVESKVSFVNVTFEDDVLAYIPTQNNNGSWSSKGGYTFIASFDDDAIFKNCIFEGKAMFKYSKFNRNASFDGSKFREDNTFKYSKFETEVSFANTVFSETATFKYTKFLDGVSFKNAKFEEDLNIKYTEVSGDFNITGMKVSYDINSKYTKINGRSFTKYLVNSRQ